MVNCQNNRGKRRRSGHSESKTPEKKPRHEIPHQESTSHASEFDCKNGLKKKRLRKRTKGLRETIKNKIEVALRTLPSPLGHLFNSRDDAGTPQAAYVEVVKAIGLSKEDWLKAVSLPPRTVESISNITDIFYIERSSENKLMVKYRPTEWNIEECTVYLDNLPEGCTAEKIRRIARKYGSVVEVRLPKSYSRTVPTVYGAVEMGRRPKAFAFVQFTDPEACQRMCAAFSGNTPGEGMKRRSQFLVPLLQRLLMQIRTLSRRRRHRTYAQNILLIKLRRQQTAIIKKERSAIKRTHRISRAAEGKKNCSNSEEKNGKIASSSDCVESDISFSESCCEHKQSSASRKKKSRSCCQKQPPKKTKRKRRKRRRHEVSPYTINGSVNDYFEKMQVFTLARYRELREEYVALRRDSDFRSKELAKKQQHFLQFCSREAPQTLNSSFGSYRERFWCANKAEDE